MSKRTRSAATAHVAIEQTSQPLFERAYPQPLFLDAVSRAGSWGNSVQQPVHLRFASDSHCDAEVAARACIIPIDGASGNHQQAGCGFSLPQAFFLMDRPPGKLPHAGCLWQ